MGLLLSEVIVKGEFRYCRKSIYRAFGGTKITSFKQTGSPTAKPVIAKSPEFPVTFVPAVIVFITHPNLCWQRHFSFTSSLKEELAWVKHRE